MPSQQQVQLLKKYLRDTLKYRETYEEVFDHIMTALDEQPCTMSFEQAVNGIIKRDFNGPMGLVLMEADMAKKTTIAAIDGQLTNIKEYFYLAKLPYTLLIFLTSCLTLYYLTFTPVVFLLLFCLGAIIPGVLVLIRYFNMGFYLGDRKKSVGDKIIGILAGRPLLVLNPAFFFLSFSRHKNLINGWVHSHLIFCALLITLLCVYVLAFTKLTREDFNPRFR